MTIEEHERFAHEALEALRREYELRAEPYIRILCQIQATRIPAMRISVDEAGGLKFEIVELAKP